MSWWRESTICVADSMPPTGTSRESTSLTTNADGGSPGSDDFNADAYLAGLEKLAAVGVTWVQVGLPGDSLAHVLETIDRFGSSVIKAVS